MANQTNPDWHFWQIQNNQTVVLSRVFGSKLFPRFFSWNLRWQHSEYIKTSCTFTNFGSKLFPQFSRQIKVDNTTGTQYKIIVLCTFNLFQFFSSNQSSKVQNRRTFKFFSWNYLELSNFIVYLLFWHFLKIGQLFELSREMLHFLTDF